MRAVIFHLDETLADGQDELHEAGAYRVSANPAELLASTYQLGLRRS